VAVVRKTFWVSDFFDKEENLWAPVQKTALELAVLISNSLPRGVLPVLILHLLQIMKSFVQSQPMNSLEALMPMEGRSLLAVAFLLNVLDNRFKNLFIFSQFTIMNHIWSKMSEKPSQQTCVELLLSMVVVICVAVI